MLKLTTRLHRITTALIITVIDWLQPQSTTTERNTYCCKKDFSVIHLSVSPLLALLEEAQGSYIMVVLLLLMWFDGTLSATAKSGIVRGSYILLTGFYGQYWSDNVYLLLNK